MNPTPVKILLFNTGPEAHVGVGWARDRLEKALPNVVLTVLDLDRKRSLWHQWKVFRAAKNERYDRSVFPYQPGYLRYPWYWIQVIMFLIGSVGTRSFITLENDFMSPQVVAQGLFRRIVERLNPPYLFRQPFISTMLLLHLPIYVSQQIIGKFILTPEHPEDEFTGFGKGKGVGGLIYWLTWTKKVKCYGLFGIAHDTYMGMPLSVHSWPLATDALGKLGFRRYVYLSAILLAIGLGWLSFTSNHPWSLILIPFILSSTYFLFNIYISTWEILAWGFGFLVFAATYAHLPAVAGIFLAYAVLTHPGASLLIGVISAGFMAANGYSLFEFVCLGVPTTVLVTWWVIPYLRSRHKMGRDFMINEIWKYPYVWDDESIYQFAIYAIFFLVSLLSTTLAWSLILLFPLILLYYNIKIHWTFSKYTIYNCMLLVGAVYLAVHSNIWALIVYLLMIYTSNRIMWLRSGSFWGFDLTPAVLGDTRQKVKSIFTNLKPGRVALEIEKSRTHIGWSLIGSISYIMANENIEILNAGYAEIGDSRIFEQYCQYFNVKATPEEFEIACRESGVKYIVAFTDGFCKQLDARGYKQVGRLSDLYLSEMPNDRAVSLTLYELPWQAQQIVPETQIQVLPGEIRFKALAGQTYLLRYGFFPGWRAFQHGKRIPLKDAQPGMALIAEHDGEVILKYRYWHYWS